MDGQGTKWHRNIAENFNRLRRAHERYRQTDDRRTDDDIIANMNLSSRSLINRTGARICTVFMCCSASVHEVLPPSCRERRGGGRLTTSCCHSCDTHDQTRPSGRLMTVTSCEHAGWWCCERNKIHTFKRTGVMSWMKSLADSDGTHACT